MKKEEYQYVNPTSIKQENDEVEEDYINVEKNLQLEIEIDYDQDKTSKNPLEECMENESSDSEEDYDNDEDAYNSSSSEDFKPPIKKEAKENNTKSSKTSPKNSNKTKRCRRKKSEIEKTNSDSNTVPKRKKAVFNRLDPVHTEEMILKHIPMGCNLCVFVGKTFGDIVTHFKAEHPDVRPYITCCDKVFTKRFYVAQHAMTHENPNCFR